MNKSMLSAIVFIITLCLAGSAAGAGKSGAPSIPVIVAMGDSLTEGYGLDETDAYPAQLERKLHAAGQTCRVINAGVSGETSSGALSRVNWILKLKPDIVILETGANDGLRGTDPQFTRENLNRIIEKFQSHNTEVILAGMAMTLNLGESFTREFASVYTQVAEAYNLTLIPFFLEGVAMVPELNLSDGMHPNARGYRVVADTVYPYVLEGLTKID
jgi:acyl-CoA thioesterase I